MDKESEPAIAKEKRKAAKRLIKIGAVHRENVANIEDMEMYSDWDSISVSSEEEEIKATATATAKTVVTEPHCGDCTEYSAICVGCIIAKESKPEES